MGTPEELERPENRCLIPVTEFAEWTPDMHDVGGGKPIKGEMWFEVPDQPVFAIAGFWQRTAAGAGFAMVTCDPNELVAPIHPKAIVTILAPEDHDRWLTCGYDEAVAMQRPFPTKRMTVRGPVFSTRGGGAGDRSTLSWTPHPSETADLIRM